jgi:hypothetical protein
MLLLLQARIAPWRDLVARILDLGLWPVRLDPHCCQTSMRTALTIATMPNTTAGTT